MCVFPHVHTIYTFPPDKVMKEHMADLGYILEYEQVDAQWFLLRQRRNRVWATLDLDGGQDEKEFRAGMRRVVHAMASHALFPEELCFRDDLPKTTNFNATEQQNVRHVHELADRKGDLNLFADVTTSVGRHEVASGVTTCIRPTHPIYSVKRERLLTVSELWGQQGLWACDFACPDIVKKFIEQKPKLAHDLAGLLTQLVHSASIHHMMDADLACTICRKLLRHDDVSGQVLG